VNDVFNAPTAGGPTRQPTEVGLRCRSLLGVLYFLSQAVEVPAPDVQAGLVTVTEDGQGRPFNWASPHRRGAAHASQLRGRGRLADDEPECRHDYHVTVRQLRAHQRKERHRSHGFLCAAAE